MKYCKKCFRNVREDVNVCPYCGAPGLEEYGSHTSGEDFTCSQPAKTIRDIQQEIDALNPNDDEDDAYSTKEDDYKPFGMFDEEETDAYGNVKKADKACGNTAKDAYGSYSHEDDCGNAPDSPKVYTAAHTSPGQSLDPNNPNVKMRIEYLNMLKKIDGITQERIDELMRRYDETHGNSTVKTYKRTTGTASSTNTVTTSQMVNTSVIISLIVAVFIGFMMPFIGIIILATMRNRLKKIEDEKVQAQARKLVNIFTVIFIIMLIFRFGSILATGIFGILNGEVFNV